VTPMCVDRIATAKAPFLREADQAGDDVVAVGEDEVARREPAGLLAWAEPLNLGHLDAITPGAA